MAADYRIIDADGHVMELDDQLAEYIGPPFDEEPQAAHGISLSMRVTRMPSPPSAFSAPMVR